MRTGWILLAGAVLCFGQERERLRPVPAAGQNLKTGPAVGARIPALDLEDQNGKRQNVATLAGPKGLLLVFVRSADW